MKKDIENKLKIFFNNKKQITHNKGDIIIQSFEDPKWIYFIEEGSVKMYFISKDGDEVTLNIFKQYSFFPMSWAINSTQNIYYYEVLTKSKFKIALKDEVVDFIKTNPDVLYDLLSRVYKGLDGILKRMTFLMSGDVYSRLITELIIYSKRFGEKTNNGIELRITEKELASETGMTRESVSRTINKLKNDGLINIENKIIVIKDLNLLESEIS